MQIVQEFCNQLPHDLISAWFMARHLNAIYLVSDIIFERNVKIELLFEWKLVRSTFRPLDSTPFWKSLFKTLFKYYTAQRFGFIQAEDILQIHVKSGERGDIDLENVNHQKPSFGDILLLRLQL